MTWRGAGSSRWMLCVLLVGLLAGSGCRDEPKPASSPASESSSGAEGTSESPTDDGTDTPPPIPAPLGAGGAPNEPADELGADELGTDELGTDELEPDAAAEARAERRKPPKPIRRQRRQTRPPKGASRDEALNSPPIALLVADRLKLVDSILTLRVNAEPGEYFNCYYKGKRNAYHHVRMRGDGGAWLDGYIPRDAEGEKLWLTLNQNKSTKLTVKVVMRAATVSDVCVGQVEVLEHEVGWDYAKGQLGAPGVLQRRIANGKDRTAARNRPSLATFFETRKRYVDKQLNFRMRGRLDRYYQCRYRDAERTHYALSLSGDGYKSLRGYIARNDRGRALAYYLAENPGGQVTVTVTVPEGRFDEVCPDQVEVVDWYKGWGPAPR